MSTDLWGHGWRVAAVDEWGNHARDDDWNYEDPDVDLHMNGGCWDWAIAHQRQNPHLRIGQEWRWNPPEERDDPEEEWTPIHAFTHDDHWAYDARGAFPLSEWRKWKGWDDVTFNHEPRDIGAGPSWPRPNPAMDELVSRNKTRPPPPGGGPVFLADRARHRPHPDLAESLRAHGTVHTTGGRVLPGRRTAVADTATQQSRLADPAGWSHHVAIAPSGLAVAGARAYASLRGLDDPHDTDYSGIMQSPERVARVGRHYDAMPDHDPAALPHYHAMLKEVGDQYDFMTNRLGIRVQPVDHDPYAHVGEMMADINGNRTLKVLGTHITGGHPVFGNEGNDKFRAVHDFFGHAATGRDFDRHGEHATYLAHARMFSPHAVPALTNETLGQNSSLILNGHFGPQKIGTIPRHHTAHRTAMPAPTPGNLDLRYRPYGDGSGIVEARLPGAGHWKGGDDLVGYLAHEADGEIGFIEVHPDHRRHGIADAMYDHADAVVQNLHHSRDRSALGDLWVEHERQRDRGSGGGLPEGVVRSMFAHRTAMPDYTRFIPDIHRLRDEIVAAGETNSASGPSCGVTAEEVAEMLRGQGIAASENYGSFRHPSGEQPEHAWVNLPGGHILDPTADQFGYEPVRILHPGHPDHARYRDECGDDHRTAHRTAMTAAVTVPVGSQHGLHTTPSMLISNAVKRTGWPVWFSDETGTRIDARDPLAVMSLGARHGAPITVHCDHPDIAAHIADYVAQDHD